MGSDSTAALPDAEQEKGGEQRPVDEKKLKEAQEDAGEERKKGGYQ